MAGYTHEVVSTAFWGFEVPMFRKVLVETCMTTNWLSIYLTLCV